MNEFSRREGEEEPPDVELNPVETDEFEDNDELMAEDATMSQLGGLSSESWEADPNDTYGMGC